MCQLSEFIEDLKTNGYTAQKEDGNYLSLPLKEGDGFLVYSKETAEDTSNKKLKQLYEKTYTNINEKNIFRYYYYEKLDPNNCLHATVVMMNPAFADSEQPDDTIKNIESYLKDNKFGSFDIVNLYPIRMPKSAKLKDFLKETSTKTKKYQKFVKEYLKKSSKENHIIIAAWGKYYHKEAEELFKDQDIKFYCYGLTKDACPKHFSKQSFSNFNKFKSPIPYIKISDWLKKEKGNLNDYDNERLKDVKKFCNLLWKSEHISEEFINNLKNNIEDIKKFLDKNYP